MLATRPGPRRGQNVIAAATTVMSTSGGFAPRYGIRSQCAVIINTTLPVEIPISGMRSLRETLGLTRRDERATANDIQNSRIPAEGTGTDATRLNSAELSHRVCLYRYRATSYWVKFFIVALPG